MLQRNPTHLLCPNRVGAGIDETAKIWSPRGELVATLEDHEYWVEEVAWHPRGDALATDSRDGAVRVWSAGRIFVLAGLLGR